MTEAMPRALGVTPEQIDCERERVHRDLIGGSTEVALCPNMEVNSERPVA